MRKCMFRYEMSVEAKVPVETNWQYVDIYVFSNGQQATPPRKYHLSNTDLNNWSDTLKTLARSQYEKIISSIDLYTTDGQQVLTPMQVSHGSAYVAVPAHDAFITAGYKDYLLKASRSQERRKSSNFNINENDNNQGKEHINQDEQDRYILEEEREIVNHHVQKNTVITLKTPTDMIYIKPPHPVQKHIDNTKQTRSAKSDIKPTVTANSYPQGLSRRTTLKNKDPMANKKYTINTHNILAGKTNNLNRANKGNFIPKSYKTRDKEITAALSATTVATIDENVQTNLSYAPKSNLTDEKKINTDNSASENSIDDKVLILVEYPDSDRNQTSSLNNTILLSIDPAGNELTTKEINVEHVINETPPQNVTTKVEENIYNPDKETNRDNVSNDINKSIDCSKAADNPIFENKLILNNNPPIDSYITVVDRKRHMNINVKIELCEDLVNAQCDTSRTKFHCLKEKCLQVNMDQDVFIDCTSKESKVLNRFNTNEKKLKIAVRHCACCNDHSCNGIIVHKICKSPGQMEKNIYVLLLPSPHQGKNNKRNTSNEKNNRMPETAYSKNSIENPVKHVNAIHLLETLENYNCLHRVETEDITKENEQSDSQMIADNRVPSFKYTITNNNQTKTNSLITIDNVTNRKLLDCNTQTDSSPLLLEARRQENGFYMFHLPPLQVLKHYGF